MRSAASPQSRAGSGWRNSAASASMDTRSGALMFAPYMTVRDDFKLNDAAYFWFDRTLDASGAPTVSDADLEQSLQKLVDEESQVDASVAISRPMVKVSSHEYLNDRVGNRGGQRDSGGGEAAAHPTDDLVARHDGHGCRLDSDAAIRAWRAAMSGNDPIRPGATDSGRGAADRVVGGHHQRRFWNSRCVVLRRSDALRFVLRRLSFAADDSVVLPVARFRRNASRCAVWLPCFRQLSRGAKQPADLVKIDIGRWVKASGLTPSPSARNATRRPGNLGGAPPPLELALPALLP